VDQAQPGGDEGLRRGPGAGQGVHDGTSHWWSRSGVTRANCWWRSPSHRPTPSPGTSAPPSSWSTSPARSGWTAPSAWPRCCSPRCTTPSSFLWPAASPTGTTGVPSSSLARWGWESGRSRSFRCSTRARRW
jgi:hypothetical protein